jgi:hypothetical protein
MKTAIVILLLILTFSLISWLRSGVFEGHILETLPFLGGKPAGPYDLACIGCILIFIWGLNRLYGSNKKEDE